LGPFGIYNPVVERLGPIHNLVIEPKNKMYSDFLRKKLSNSVFGFSLLYTIIDQI